MAGLQAGDNPQKTKGFLGFPSSLQGLTSQDEEADPEAAAFAGGAFEGYSPPFFSSRHPQESLLGGVIDADLEQACCNAFVSRRKFVE